MVHESPNTYISGVASRCPIAPAIVPGVPHLHIRAVHAVPKRLVITYFWSALPRYEMDYFQLTRTTRILPFGTKTANPSLQTGRGPWVSEIWTGGKPARTRQNSRKYRLNVDSKQLC
ncbi:hypothetical protein J6590_039755 [Homalodisca vitripennis]|nr:hypothetical protein J6590_039755 [Homalodisca vitripennis]